MLVVERPSTDTLDRVRAEYLDLPGLKLTPCQAQRLFCLDPSSCEAVLNTLVDLGFLRCTPAGLFMRSDVLSTESELHEASPPAATHSD
jgi:hypothetical protein